VSHIFALLDYFIFVEYLVIIIIIIIIIICVQNGNIREFTLFNVDLKCRKYLFLRVFGD